MSKTFVEVFLDQNLAKPLDYEVPKHLKVEVGMRVEVPLKSTSKLGTIAKIKHATKWETVKPIIKVISSQAELSDAQWLLANWMAKYYAAPMQRVLKCFIPINVRKKVKEKTHILLTLTKTHDESIQAIQEMRSKRPKQAIVLEQILNCPKGLYLSDLEGSKSAVQTLIKNKWVTSKLIKISDLFEEEFFPTLPKKLNSEQQTCLSKIIDSLNQKNFNAHLIYGITGSGKTEVYMQAISAALKNNQSAIMLVPEISLTSQTIERFKARFSEKIAILHHKRSLGQRTSAWEELQKGDAKLVIGARSALFCPAQNLGLIIVDEEHDSSYKQSDETPAYHGRDTAVMRAYFEKCTILLGSATPSIESRYNAEVGKYHYHELNARATKASLPKVKIVDMVGALERAGGFTHFCDELLTGIKKRLELGEQTLLFLNKRGFHRQQICSSCRHVIKCPHCDLALTFHKQANFLKCHLCDYRCPAPKACPNCSSRESLEFKGFGTEHVERTLHAIFPEVRTIRMDRDTTSQKTSHEDLFKQFRAHKADVLIGTQMVAKGFHFPSVTLVGVLNTDATLNIPDFRSQEVVFQLLTQVAGRAGRAELEGEVIIQTFLPEHPTIQLAAKQDYPTFYKREIEERKAFSYPPFCHIVKLVFSNQDEEIARKQAEEAYQKLEKTMKKPFEMLPVIPSGHAKVKDLFRYQFLIKVLKISQIEGPLKEIQGAKIDVDPISTYF